MAVSTDIDIVAERAQIVREALEWAGTPFQHRQMVKRVGCDCLTFLAAVYAPLLGVALHLPDYRPDEWLHNAEERYRDGLAIYFDDLDTIPPEPGDVVTFHFGRRQVSHCGICVDAEGGFLSATLENACVEYARLSQQYWARRWSGTWRLKRWGR